jgi:hypothetical protein
MTDDITNPIYKDRAKRPQVRVKVPESIVQELLGGSEVQDVQRNFFNVGSWVASCPDWGPRLWTITPPEGMKLPPQLEGKFAGRETCRRVLVQYLEAHPEKKEVLT